MPKIQEPKREIKRTQCCHLLKLKKHGQKTTNLSKVSPNNLEKLRSLGHLNVTTDDFICSQCRWHLTNKFTTLTTEQQENQEEQQDTSITSLDNEMDYEPENNNISVPTSQEILEAILFNLKNLILNTNDSAGKILLLRLLPEYLSHEEVMRMVGSSLYLINKSKNPPESNITPKRGRPGVSQQLKERVIQYYLDDEVSRQCPGMKDTISVKDSNGQRTNKQKRVLQRTMQELYDGFKDKNEISFTSFQRLRPKECVFVTDSAAHNVCVCTIHQNTELMVEGLRKTGAFDQDVNGDKELLQLLSKKMMCHQPLESCYLRECSSCSYTPNNEDNPTNAVHMVDFVANKLDIQQIETVTYNMWLTSPPDFIETQENVDNFLDRFKHQLEKFITHEFKRAKQFEFIKKTKASLVHGKTVMCQLDFAENYSCITQNATQAAYFHQKHVTIHPMVVFYKDENGLIKNWNHIVISDVMAHDTKAVYSFQKKLIRNLKERFPELEEIIYISDGCAAQYKNKNNFKNICLHEKDFGIKAQWHFFPTSHGKGCCDGIGGMIKRNARDACLRQKCHIKDAATFYNWAIAEQARWKGDYNIIYVSEADYTNAENDLKDRFCNLRTISGTQKLHEFKPVDEDHINVNLFSGRSEPFKIFKI